MVRRFGSAAGGISLALHERRASMPRLTNFFANGVITMAELVKNKSIQLCNIYFPLLVQHGFICQDTHDFTEDMMSVNFHLILNNFTFQG